MICMEGMITQNNSWALLKDNKVNATYEGPIEDIFVFLAIVLLLI